VAGCVGSRENLVAISKCYGLQRTAVHHEARDEFIRMNVVNAELARRETNAYDVDGGLSKASDRTGIPRVEALPKHARLECEQAFSRDILVSDRIGVRAGLLLTEF